MDKTIVIHPMVIRTEENNVVEHCFSPISYGDNVANINRSLFPSTKFTFDTAKFFEGLSPYSSAVLLFFKVIKRHLSFLGKINRQPLTRTFSRAKASREPAVMVNLFSTNLAFRSYPVFLSPKNGAALTRTCVRTCFSVFNCARKHFKLFAAYFTSHGNTSSFCVIASPKRLIKAIWRAINMLRNLTRIFLDNFSTHLTCYKPHLLSPSSFLHNYKVNIYLKIFGCEVFE